jgi:AraC-like DNA-binding protein
MGDSGLASAPAGAAPQPAGLLHPGQVDSVGQRIATGRQVADSEIIIRSMCCGVLFAVGIAMLRGGRGSLVGQTGALFCLATCGFVVHTCSRLAETLGPVRHLAWLLSSGGTAYFWLFAMAIFDDRPFTWKHLLPPLLMTGIAIIGRILGPAAQIGTETVHNLFEVVLVLHIVMLIRQRADGDLIEARRSFRVPFLLAVALFCVILSAVDVALTLGVRHPGIKLGQAIALLIMSALGAWALLPISAGLADETAAAAAASAEPADAPGLARLQALLDDAAFWRQPGLTLADTARRLAIPEYRLRRLISQQLGFRNFPDLVNAQRIAQAKALLADPAQADERISAIAFDLGYASLGPFNRAFRAVTSMTPREWRQHQNQSLSAG